MRDICSEWGGAHTCVCITVLIPEINPVRDTGTIFLLQLCSVLLLYWSRCHRVVLPACFIVLWAFVSSLESLFDEFELEKPATGNPAFSTHTKGDKFEQLLAYLYNNSSLDPFCAEMFCRLMRHVLDAGHYDCPAINTDYEVCEFDDWHKPIP